MSLSDVAKKREYRGCLVACHISLSEHFPGFTPTCNEGPLYAKGAQLRIQPYVCCFYNPDCGYRGYAVAD
eukprot:4488066-Pleurochrysis_carterae.AAC.1